VLIKFKDWPLNKPFIAPNSRKYPTQHSQQGLSSLQPWEKSPWPCLSLFLFFIFFLLPTSRRQSINQDQTLWHSWPLAQRKPPYIALHWKQQRHFSLLACFKAAWLKLQKKQVSITHHTWLPFPTPHPTHPTPLWENNPVQPLGRQNSPPQQNWKTNNKL
jgi:hypothetical protein